MSAKTVANMAMYTNPLTGAADIVSRVTTGKGVLSHSGVFGDETPDAVKAQKKLEDERRAQLAAEAATRAAAKAKAETTGQRVGFGSGMFAGGFGFGSAKTSSVRGNLFGN